MIGFHASHEQAAPSDLLTALGEAEEAGFGAAMCSDHFAPWSARQGHSGYAWSWLGSALEATNVSLGVVTAPVQRYHPAVSAQAVATLSEMYPNRFWAALGSGENINEHITGGVWPPKAERDARLLEAVAVIRDLLEGREVSADGLIRVDRARLWSLPATSPALFGAAVSAVTARTAGNWADGLITVNQPTTKLEEVLAAFHETGPGKPAYLQVHLSWAETEDQALDIAHDQWKTNVFGSALAWNLETPAQFDDAARFVGREDVRRSVLVSSDLDRHVDWLSELFELVFERIYLHHVGQEQSAFIRAFGQHVLPKVTGQPSES
jgi:probable non-F420 flavinoid oxidoreductase